MNPLVKTYGEFLYFLHFLQWFLIVQKAYLSAKTLFVKVLHPLRVYIDYSTFVLFLEGSGGLSSFANTLIRPTPTAGPWSSRTSKIPEAKRRGVRACSLR